MPSAASVAARLRTGVVEKGVSVTEIVMAAARDHDGSPRWKLRLAKREGLEIDVVAKTYSALVISGKLNPTKCPICRLVFADRVPLAKHLRQEHGWTRES